MEITLMNVINRVLWPMSCAASQSHPGRAPLALPVILQATISHLEDQITELAGKKVGTHCNRKTSIAQGLFNLRGCPKMLERFTEHLPFTIEGRIHLH